MSLAYGCRTEVALLNKFDENEIPILSFKKHDFAYRAFTLMFIYRKESMYMQECPMCCNIY